MQAFRATCRAYDEAEVADYELTPAQESTYDRLHAAIVEDLAKREPR